MLLVFVVSVMELKKYTVCFTGHRKIPPEQMDTLARRLKKAIIELNKKIEIIDTIKAVNKR